MKVNLFEGLANGTNYQFPRWSTTISRPYSSSPSKEVVKETFQLGVDNRNQLQRPESAVSTKRIIKHHVCIPTGTRLISPPPLTQPSTSPDLNRKLDHSSLPKARSARLYRSIPVRIKSAALTIPTSKTKKEFSLQNFPKQTHEQRKITHERKRRIQQAQILAEKYAETERWFQLKRSLSELKRLATVQDILTDSQTSVLHADEEKKPAGLKSESGPSTPFSSGVPSRESNRTSVSTSQNSFYRSRITKQSIETYSQLVFKPLIVASKPIHPFLVTDNHHPSPISRLKPPSSPVSRFRPTTTPLSDEKRAQLLISDLSTNDDDDRLTPTTPSPSLVKIEHETLPRKISIPSPTRLRAPSSLQLTSTIKLRAQIPRCRSATDIKSPHLTTKDYPRFILIVDQEHRIESWYYQYPFIHADDLLTAFQSKSSQQISAFFIDDLQSSKSNLTATTFLRGKPFHINNDWKKYDLIFISKNIYEEIIIYLQTIVNLIKLSGKTIEIYQINHEEDLKKQVKKYF